VRDAKPQHANAVYKYRVSFYCALPIATELLISNPFVTPSFMLKRNLQYRFDPSSRYARFLSTLQLGLGGYTIAMLDVELVYVFKQFGEWYFGKYFQNEMR
jgi:hypothetical protein